MNLEELKGKNMALNKIEKDISVSITLLTAMVSEYVEKNNINTNFELMLDKQEIRELFGRVRVKEAFMNTLAKEIKHYNQFYKFNWSGNALILGIDVKVIREDDTLITLTEIKEVIDDN